MSDHQDGYFGEGVAARYGESEGERFDPQVIGATVDFLAELAGNGAALEFAIGTGRIAVPLAERDAMVITRIDGSFSLVYVETLPGRPVDPERVAASSS